MSGQAGTAALSPAHGSGRARVSPVSQFPFCAPRCPWYDLCLFGEQDCAGLLCSECQAMFSLLHIDRSSRVIQTCWVGALSFQKWELVKKMWFVFHCPGRLYGADDFLPVLTYVLAQCDMLELDTEIEYMMELLDPSLLHGEGNLFILLELAEGPARGCSSSQHCCCSPCLSRNSVKGRPNGNDVDNKRMSSSFPLLGSLQRTSLRDLETCCRVLLCKQIHCFQLLLTQPAQCALCRCQMALAFCV